MSNVVLYQQDTFTNIDLLSDHRIMNIWWQKQRHQLFTSRSVLQIVIIQQSAPTV